MNMQQAQANAHHLSGARNARSRSGAEEGMVGVAGERHKYGSDTGARDC